MADEAAVERLTSGVNFFKQGEETHATFVMPQWNKAATNSSVGFTIETLSAILNAKDLLPTLGRKLTFIAARSAGGAVASILISELFDTAVADLLDTVGDASLSAAVQALRDGVAEKDSALRLRHRATAESLLRMAFASYEAAVGSRQKKLL